MQSSKLVECIPNFSEGRNKDTLFEIEKAIKEVNGVILLEHSADYDHNRSVYTFCGSIEGVKEPVFRHKVLV